MKWNMLVNPACQLGEGVCWSTSRQAMLFVDIHGQRVLSYHIGSGHLQEWRSPQRIGWLIARTGHADFLAGMQEGFAFVDLTEMPGDIQPRWLAKCFGTHGGLRLNDAKADIHGRVWAGSLNNDDESQALGVLFKLETDGQVVVMDKDYCVANGPAISPDGRLLLHTDSARRVIHAFDMAPESGSLSNKRVWKTFNESEGYPDGMNFDSHGHLWVAHWGAGCVSRFSQHGALLDRVQLPVSNVTNLAFGGPALDRLFVTTAWQGLDEEQRQAQPLAGAFFEILDHQAVGLPPLSFGG
jgi:sugar lactone lactonase YvrE